MRKIICICLACAALVLCGCNEKDKEKKAERKPVTVEVMTVGGSDINLGSEYVGTVEETVGTSLSFEVPGNISSIKVGEGDKVSAGQVLATVNATTLGETHRAALVTLRQARDAYNRFKPLHEQGTISDLRWIDLQTKLEQAEAAEATARKQLANTTLRAPFGGVIASKTAEMGANVVPGQQVLKLVSIGRVNVKLSVPEAEISRIAMGDAADISVQALGGQRFGGVVTEKGIGANPVSHTYDVKVRVDNTAMRLMPGMVCSVRLHRPAGESAPSEAEQGIAVPPGCVELDVDNTRFVWLVSGGKAVKRNVTIGSFTGDNVSVTSGLKAGDRVIVGGQQKVSEGMKVAVR